MYGLQFGFWEKHSTELTLICLIKKMISSIERNEFITTLFLDLSKAFDMVGHQILLKNFFTKVSKVHRHYTKSQCNVHVGASRIIYVDESVKYRGTLLWNRLRDNVKNPPNFNIFNEHLVSFYVVHEYQL